MVSWKKSWKSYSGFFRIFRILAKNGNKLT